MAAQLSRRKKVFFTLFFFAFLMVAFLGFEWGVRKVWVAPWERSTLGSIDPAVFAEYAFPKPAGESYEGRYIRLNAHGFRNDAEFDFSANPGFYNIVYLGASVAFGAWSTSRAAATQGILENCLAHRDGRKVRILSLAESGAEVADEMFWLMKLGLRLRPQLVISLTGYNNLMYASIYPKLWDVGSGSRGFARPGVQSPLSENTLTSIKRAFLGFVVSVDRYLYAKLRSYKLLKHVFGLESGYDIASGHAEAMKSAGERSPAVESGTKSTVEILLKIKDTLEREKIPSLFFFQPVYGCSERALDPASRVPSNPARDRMLCAALRKEAPAGLLVDLSKTVGAQLEQEGAFMDPVHLNDAGFKLLGRAMCGEIVSRVPELRLKN